MKDAQLTARGVKAMLTRSGVDYSQLEIVDDPRVWTNLTTGRRGRSVVIHGSREARRASFHALLDRGLAVAPYPDRDEWSR